MSAPYSAFQTTVTSAWVLSQLDTFSSKKARLFVEIQGEVRIGVCSPLWALERVGLRGICFSFCQLEFPFQIPFWLYDQATAVFMGGHRLAGGADLVRKKFFFFFFPSKGSSRAAAFSRNVAERVLIWGSQGPGSETRLHPSELCYSSSLLFKLCPVGMVPFWHMRIFSEMRSTKI